MSLASALAASFGPGMAVVLLVLLVLDAVLYVALPPARRRLGHAAFSAGLSLGAFVLAAAIAWGGGAVGPTARYLGALGRVLAALSAINAAAALVFDAILPRLNIRLSALARDLIMAVAYALGILAALTAVGVNLSGLVATSAVMTAIIAFSLQDTLGNVLGGMVLQLDRTLEPGDWVRVGADEGIVREIRWRQTQIATTAGDLVIVPNSALMKGVVTALGRRDNGRRRRCSISFIVPQAWGPGEVISAVERALRDDPPPHVLPDPAPHVLLMELLEGKASYAARFWIDSQASYDAACSAARVRVFYGLSRAGIATATEPTQAISFEDAKAVRERRSGDELRRRLAALRGVDLFKALTEEEVRTLADRLKPAPFARGEALTRQGATGHWLYILAKGEAEVQLRGDAGGEKEKIARLKAGDFMGEMALLTGEPRTATVVAVEDVEAYRLDRESFRDIVERRPEIAEHISHVLAARRVGLETARGTLDSRRRDETLKAAQGDLLTRIRRFLALN